jgi:hypothetical protein
VTRTALPELSDDARGFVRNVGGLVLGFAALMLALTAYLRYSGMLWMDIPLSLIGGYLLLWSYVARSRGAG